jgi:hypothetical protein
VDGQPLIDLLGRPADDPAVEAAFVALQTRRRPELDPEDRDAVRDWVLVRRQGIEFGFVDAVWFNAGAPVQRRRVAVPLLLNQIYRLRRPAARRLSELERARRGCSACVRMRGTKRRGVRADRGLGANVLAKRARRRQDRRRGGS